MNRLNELLNSISQCKACYLMDENDSIGIPYIQILPKPDAKVIFIGRDPSPQTAKVVGVRGGRSVFIKEVFRIIDQSGVSEDLIYITDLCKCHWRTSVGKPLQKTKHRTTTLDVNIANLCLNHWLSREIEILEPKLIVSFGEELYQILRPFIINPKPVPEKLSAKVDKLVLDAEYWFVNNGAFTIKLNDTICSLAVLRHPGNSSRLSQQSSIDQRLQFHKRATQQVIELLKDIY